jgi:DNA-binding SARP family transcriptional activator
MVDVRAGSARRLVCVLGGLALALYLTFLVLGGLGSSSVGPRIVAADRVLFAVFLFCAAVGVLVASRRPENPIGWLLVIEGLLFLVTAFGLAYSRYALFVRPGSLPAGEAAAWIGEWIWILEFFSVPALFFVLFPDGRLRSRRWRTVVWLIAAVTVAGCSSSAFAPGNLDGSYSSVRNPFGIEGAGPALGVVGSVANALAGPALIAALVASALRFRASRGRERQQLKWVAYAAVLLLVSFTMGDLLQALSVPASITSNFWTVPVSFIPIAAGVAVLGYRLYDIDVLVSKSVVFGGVAAFATAVYVALTAGVGAAVGRTTGSNVGLTVVATAVVAVAFQPVRDRLHHVARRLVFGAPTTAERQAGVAIHCLGAFRLFRDGKPVPAAAWQSKKARTLLKILVARRGRSTTRDFLMEALWPQESPELLANRLSVALATVRAVLDPNKRHPPDRFIAGDKDAVRLHLEHVPVDVVDFLTLAARGLALQREGQEAGVALRAAEAAYAGDFLEEDPYEDWAIPLREEARSSYITVARTLAHNATASGDHDAAAGYYLRILEKDGWDEPAHLGLVRTLESAGRHGEARRRYRAYVSRMEEIQVPVAPFPASQRA